ncbi:hypothetical protein Cflav_PD0798 [Pedosphaera parvula Ellin514]|uniref:Uncharacterized protein n=1 Tax=Pedosphaera parvula (strain Ellin514) TaxID=320771 RepID=B9XQN4_PEDPL|nr:hypothetical protein Cflav_PD0798 [Pedosphaera parvula Ellin514]
MRIEARGRLSGSKIDDGGTVSLCRLFNVRQAQGKEDSAQGRSGLTDTLRGYMVSYIMNAKAHAKVKSRINRVAGQIGAVQRMVEKIAIVWISSRR